MTQFETSLSPNRRSFLASVAAAGTIGFLGFASSRRADALRTDQPTAQPPAGGGGESIRPFLFKASKEDLGDTRRHSGKHHAVLADQDSGLVSSALLGI